MLEIDGSLLEGGGQLLRMTVGLSSLLQKSVKIYNIRGRRAKPGLKAQHLNGLQLIETMTQGASARGLTLHSKEITFIYDNTKTNRVVEQQKQQQHHHQNFEADTQTAGAVTLLAQISVPVALFQPIPTAESIKFNFKGGTNAEMAPNIDYYINVFLPIVSQFGVHIDIDVRRKGYFPKGGGIVDLKVNPLRDGRSLNPVTIDKRGHLEEIVIYASVAGQIPFETAEKMATSAMKTLVKAGQSEKLITLRPYVEKSYFGNGSSITLVATTSTGCILGGSAIGSPKTKPETTGTNGANDLLKSISNPKICVDEYIQDQLIIYMALANGCSKITTGPITLHTKTAIYIAELLLTNAKFKILEQEQNCIIECTGSAFKK